MELLLTRFHRVLTILLLVAGSRRHARWNGRGRIDRIGIRRSEHRVGAGIRRSARAVHIGVASDPHEAAGFLVNGTFNGVVVVVLAQHLGALTSIGAVAVAGATEVIVKHVDLVETTRRHALITILRPPIVMQRDALHVGIRLGGIAGDHDVTMIGSGVGVIKLAPGNRHVIRTVVDVARSIRTIEEIAVSDPYVLHTKAGDAVASANVIGICDVQVPNDDVGDAAETEIQRSRDGGIGIGSLNRFV